MILAFYTARLRTLRHRARQTWRWARKHPRLSVVILLAAGWTVMVAAGATAAYADGGGQVSLPFLPPTPILDTHGVSLNQYAILPLDRGDLFSPDKSLIANIIDPIWVGNIVAIGWMLWLFEFLLSFQWVGWIAAPLKSVALLTHGILSHIGWVPLALAAAGLIGGLVMFSGRYSKGAAEIAISVLCSALAVGILANPVSALTGPNGALHWAESWGADISVSIVGNSTTLADTSTSSKDASTLLSTTITSQLMDIFVREPAQVIAFGTELTGDCDATFTAQMKTASPIDTGSTAVRDAVAACDSDAGDYVTHPNFGQVFTVLIIDFGSDILFLLGLALSIVLMMCVFYSLWQALKLMIAVYAAIAPGVARRALWNSLIGMYVGAFSVGMCVVLLSVYLKIITSLMTSTTEAKLNSVGNAVSPLTGGANLNIVSQTGIIDLVVVVLIISLFVARHHAKKTGETIAARLARLGFASQAQTKSHPILSSAARVAESYVGRRMAEPRKKPEVVKKVAKKAIDVGTYSVVRDQPGSGPARPALTTGSQLASRTASSVSTIAQISAAAATGGTSAVIMKASTIAGKTVLQRQAQSLFQRNSGASSTPAGTPFGRQIVVGNDGVGTIAPREAPRSAGVYNVTTLPHPRAVGASPVRAALERAATSTATPS